MKKLYLIVLAFCALAIAALFLLPSGTGTFTETKNDVPASVQTQNNQVFANTFLWKLEKEGGPTSYLLGTLHLGKINEDLSPLLVRALDETTTLVTEANVMPEGQEMLEIGMMMMDMEGSLSQKLGQSRFDRLANEVGSVLPKSALEKMQPWAALTLIMYNKPEGYSEQFGVDMLLTKKAVEYGKHRVFLEQIQDSLKIFSQLPENKVLSLIDISLDHATEAKADTLEIINLYRAHQFNAVAAALTDKEKLLKYYPEQEREFWDKWFNQELLIKRNEKWFPILENQLAVESTLVAVGALHLVGEDGLIEWAKRAGYTVTPVMPD